MAETPNHEPRRFTELAVVTSLAVVVLGGALGWRAWTSTATTAQLGAESSAVATNVPVTVSSSVVASVTPTDDATPAPITQIEGIPAIQPSLGQTPDNLPAFTMADLTHYIEFAYPSSEIVGVEYVSGFEIEARHGRALGSYGDRLIAVVSLNGEFSVRVPPEVPPITATRMSVLFDAHTGNELAWTYPE